jgi:hypothetical protein
MKYFLAVLFLAYIFFPSCGGCPSKVEEPTRVSSGAVTLKGPAGEQGPYADQPNVRVIKIGPSKDASSAPESAASVSSPSADVPREVAVDASLTSRLKDKLNAAFEGKGTAPPEIEIFTGNMSLDAFAQYYESRGRKIQRTSVPASQIIGPLLEEKPELAGKISLGNYSGVTINQVIVEGQNISAADKYIDPVTYEIVYKTFVTVTKTK